MGNDQSSIMKELIKSINRLNENIEAQNAPKKEFLSAQEAAIIVGLKVTKSKNYRNKLTTAYKRGFMPNSIPGRPYMFHLGDCKELARKRANGLIL